MNNKRRARAALAAIPANLPREEWHEVGRAALAAGLAIDDVNDWSETADNYKGRRDVESAFRTIQANGGTGAGTLFHHAKQYGFSDATDRRPARTIAKPAPSPQTPVKEAANALAVWDRCIAATHAEEYINRKQGKPDGVRVYPASAPPLLIGKGDAQINAAGGLVVPCWSGDKLQTLQIIPRAGAKKNLPGASFNDGFFTVGQITDRAYIVEGIGQAWAVNQATGCAAVVCFGAGRMATVAKTLRTLHPAARLVIVPDKGKEAEAAKIAAAVSGEWVAMPDDKPNNYDANDYMQDNDPAALLALLERVKAPVMRYKLLSGADLWNAPPMRWMVRGVLPLEGLAALYGASGSGKSFLMLDIAAAVAGGEYEWFGRRVTQAPVTYVCLEGEAGTGKRVKAWSLHHDKAVPDCLRFITQPFDLLSDDVTDLARAVIAGGGAGGLVILDTLNRAAPGADENSSVDMGNLIASAKELQSLTGGLVLLVHHTGKDTTKGLRGHSSLYAALDGAIEVKANDSRRAWSVAKCKDDVTGDSHSFKLEIVPVGNDDKGDEITSCVIVVDESSKAINQRKNGLGANQKIAQDILEVLLRDSTFNKVNVAPKGKKCIDYNDAVARISKHMTVDDKHKKQSAIRALNSLIANGLLYKKENWLWDA